MRRTALVATLAGAIAFLAVPAASAHFGTTMHTRFEAQANLRLGLVKAGYVPRRLTCNVERRIIGVHFICYLVVLGRERFVCYHALARRGPILGRFALTRYRGYGCRQFY